MPEPLHDPTLDRCSGASQRHGGNCLSTWVCDIDNHCNYNTGARHGDRTQAQGESLMDRQVAPKEMNGDHRAAAS